MPGVLRLKKRKDSKARRVLLRNSSTGKITIVRCVERYYHRKNWLISLLFQNFAIYQGLKPTVSKKILSFVGHEDGESTLFKLRLKTDEQAVELMDAMIREVEALESN